MKDPRTIPVKALLNADEFVSFTSELVGDETQSGVLRGLAKAWAAERKNKRERQQQGRTGFGQNVAMLLPGRANYGARGQLRMRL